MKKLTAPIVLMLCLILSVSLVSCALFSEESEEEKVSEEKETKTVQASDSGNDTSKNENEPAPVLTEEELAALAYNAVMRNEIPMVYETGEERYLLDVISYGAHVRPQQASVDMDEDGIDEIVIVPNDSYYTKYILHYEDGIVYGYRLESMRTVYTDGSFYWYNYEFVSETGCSRLSFCKEKLKFQEIYREESYVHYYLAGIEVSQKEYEEYQVNHPQTAVTMTSMDMAYWNEGKVLKLAESYWGITNGSFDEATGYRYRMSVQKYTENQYFVCLYWFVENDYYQNIKCVLVDLSLGEVTLPNYSHGNHYGGKG